jgi:hypothetical protein
VPDGTPFPRHRRDRHRWSQAVGAAGPWWHGGVDGVRLGWLVVQPLFIGFLARTFQFGYLALGLAILSL